MNGEAWRAKVHSVTKSQTRLSDFPFTFFHLFLWLCQVLAAPYVIFPCGTRA